MKTNTFVGFASLLLVVVYILVLRIEPDEYKEITSFIPDTALLYWEQHNGSTALKEFSDSPLGKKFESIDFMATGEKVGLKEASLSTLQNILSIYETAKDHKLVHEVLGKRFALAILPPSGGSQNFNISDFIKENSVIVAEPQHSATLLEILGENYGKYGGDDISVSTSQYGNHHIKRIETGGLRLSMVTIDGFFIMSLNERQLRRCIDTFDSEMAAISQDKDFFSLGEDFHRPDRYFYLPIKSVRSFLSGIIAEQDFTANDLLLKELETTIGFTAFGYGSSKNNDKVVDKVIIRYNSEQVNTLVKNHLATAPTQNSMFSLTTKNPMAYYWSNTFDFSHFLLYFNDNTESDPRVVEFISRVESITGKKIEEILSLLGNQVSLVLEPGSNKNFFPFPLGVFFVDVKETEELGAIFDKLVDAYKIPISTKIFGSVRYSYWTPSPQDGLQPLYGFMSDKFFFGNSSKLLRRITEKNPVDVSLLDNPVLRGMDPGITEKNNSITYFNDLELIRVFKRLLNLLGTIVGIEDSDTAYKVRVISDEIIDPLLDGATMFDRSVTRSYFTPEKVVIDSVTHISSDTVTK